MSIKVEKQPWEERPIKINLTNSLPKGALVDSITSVTALNVDDDSDVTDVIINGSEIKENGKWIWIWVKGGVNNMKVHIELRFECDDGPPATKLEEDIILSIIEE